MKAYAVVELGLNKRLRIDLDPLEIAEMVAIRHGFYDLDVDMDQYGTKIVATAPKQVLTVKGKSTEQAVERLLEELNG